MRVIKVMCPSPAQDEVARRGEVVDHYDGFVVLRVKVDVFEELRKLWPIEDITSQYTIQLGQHRINTSRPRINKSGNTLPHGEYRSANPLSRGPHHYLVQFRGPVKAEWLEQVRGAGGEVRKPLSNFTVIVRANGSTIKRIAALDTVRWVGHLSHRHRVRVAGKELNRSRRFDGLFMVEFFSHADMNAAEAKIKRLGLKVVGRNDGALIMTLDADGHSSVQLQRVISELSSIHGVFSIERRAIMRPANTMASQIIGKTPDFPYNGSGETVVVCDTGLDTGDPDNIHPAFAGRVAWIESWPISSDFHPYILNPEADLGGEDVDSGHGTHVAGSVLGGRHGPPGEGFDEPGIAPGAVLGFQAIEQEVRWKKTEDALNMGRFILAGIPSDLWDLFRSAYNSGARIHSNSWGGGEGGIYDYQCSQLDDFVWHHRDFCIVVAAGNDGTDADGDGIVDFGSVASPACAKNCITVGASESFRPDFIDTTYGRWWPRDYPTWPLADDPMANDPDSVAAFSSRGPTNDGRIKPDVVAPGTFIASARSRFLGDSNNAWGRAKSGYFYMGGTSMATPIVSGAAAIIRQFLRETIGFPSPSAALVKAVLIASATRLPGYSKCGVIADNHQGFGRIDIVKAVAQDTFNEEYVDVAEVDGLTTGLVDEWSFTVSEHESPLEIVMAYTDYPGPQLVNNLNLILSRTDTTVPSWWAGNVNGGSLELDVANNVEAIKITASAGNYVLRVIGSSCPRGPQNYALVVRGAIQVFQFEAQGTP